MVSAEAVRVEQVISSDSLSQGSFKGHQEPSMKVQEQCNETLYRVFGSQRWRLQFKWGNKSRPWYHTGKDKIK